MTCSRDQTYGDVLYEASVRPWSWTGLRYIALFVAMKQGV